MARVVTYECDQCGSEIIVTETSETVLSPIYCCGLEVLEVSSQKKKPATGKSAMKGKPKKHSAKKVAAKKSSATKKKSSAKSR